MFFLAFLNPGKTFIGLLSALEGSQAIPLFIKFITSFSIASLILLSILFFSTLLFGRIYCSFLCPLGILQDLIIFVKNKISPNKFKYFKKFKIRYAILLISAVSAIGGFMIIISILDPYSLFGRIVSDFIRHIYILANNLTATILESFDVFIIRYQRSNPFSLISILTASTFLTIIIAASALKGRFWCYTICPVGTTLSLINKISLFQIKINSKCISCKKCEQSCKSTCIDIDNKKLDFEDCVACYNCIDVCPAEAIGYEYILKNPSNNKKGFSISRRNFIPVIKGVFISAIMVSSYPLRNVTKVIRQKDKNKFILPPGSKSTENLLSRCVSCHLCVSACPTNIIKPSKGMFQPVLDYNRSFCEYNCNSCSQVCPTDAINNITLSEKQKTSIGEVVFTEELCIVSKDSVDCGACAEHCPTGAVVTERRKNLNFPVTDISKCIGCGACEFVCPAEPIAIIVKPKDPHSKISDTIEKSIEKTADDDGFAF